MCGLKCNPQGTLIAPCLANMYLAFSSENAQIGQSLTHSQCFRGVVAQLVQISTRYPVATAGWTTAAMDIQMAALTTYTAQSKHGCMNPVFMAQVDITYGWDQKGQTMALASRTLVEDFLDWRKDASWTKFTRQQACLGASPWARVCGSPGC